MLTLEQIPDLKCFLPSGCSVNYILKVMLPSFVLAVGSVRSMAFDVDRI